MATLRLTVRTLLAYLDDTLEPAQAKVIGQKIAESEVAQRLVERIKQVMRNPAVTAPVVEGQGSNRFDANITADYLDNLLTGDRLEDVEKLLLRSDVLLAEVAGSHQILTLFLSQPAAVPPLAQERMYGLIEEQKPADKKPARVLPPEIDDEEDEDLADDDLGDGEEARPAASSLKVRQSPVPLVPVVAGLLLVALIVLAVWKLLPPGGPPDDTGAIASNTVPPTGSEKAATTQAADTGTKPPDKTDKQPDKTEKPPEKEPDKQPDKTEKPPEKEPDKVDKQPIEKVAPNKPSAERKELAKLLPAPVNRPAVLLARKPQSDIWGRVRADGRVTTGDLLVSLPGYRSELLLQGGVQLTLAGSLPEFSPEYPELESAVVLHVPEPPFDADLTVDHGRIVLSNLKAQGEARVRLRFIDEIWDLTLKDAQTEVSLDLGGIFPPEVPFIKDGSGDGPYRWAMLYALKGQAELKVRYSTFALPAPSIYEWNNRRGPASGPKPAPGLPGWYTNPTPTGTQINREFLAALDDLEARLAKKSAEVALAEMRKEQRPASRVVGLRGQAAVDFTSEVVDGLADDRDVDREHAVELLRRWIGRDKDNELKLYKVLQDKKGFTPAQAEMIMELLHFFGREARERPETYEKLIENLRHDKPAIRQLSAWHLYRMVPDGQKIPYNPMADSKVREAAYQAWKKVVPSGKVPAPPMPPKG